MRGEIRTTDPSQHGAAEAGRQAPVFVGGSRRAWRPPPAIKLSAACHGAAGALVAFAPPLWPWALGAVAANHLLLLAACFFPRSSLLGPNLVRLPEPAIVRREFALTFDDGPDPEATPRVLDLLDGAGVRASFFCIGRRAREHPAVVREIVARGHRVENHGDSHTKAFATYGYGRLRADIVASQETLADITGQRPRFFRPLGGFRSPLLDPVLAALDLRLASWTRRGFDSVQGDPEGVYRRLVYNLAPGDILLMHDGDAARSPTGEPVSLLVLPRLLAAMREAALHPVTLAEAVP
jgi:peptidoglycan/xylan/chitin deacetylase (PgdA/CDA1 family)